MLMFMPEISTWTSLLSIGLITLVFMPGVIWKHWSVMNLARSVPSTSQANTFLLLIWKPSSSPVLIPILVNSLARDSFSILPVLVSTSRLISSTFLLSLSFLPMVTFGLLAHLLIRGAAEEPTFPPPSTPPVDKVAWSSAIGAGNFSEFRI